MNELLRIAHRLKHGRVHPNEALNLFIEVDNRAGLEGLHALEEALETALHRLQHRPHPSTRLLARWLEALRVYRSAAYPSPKTPPPLSKEVRRVAY
ncbi:hypothetical protein [Marinithermus hydrothermalis]|uniref:Uncharacterized protein n=1 Tax=Marinithermus hydrothermalis (strain DSM 14884 / JCM 11576 / T1) TaxID=869210 RepID=F2NL71_MARHT|nr:hypothetical protein [Marinithermus hydrothermalis]AEB11474.1 hypothetical protein Marky_0724 [Marinithermus hydrothermalis DSM 14884]